MVNNSQVQFFFADTVSEVNLNSIQVGTFVYVKDISSLYLKIDDTTLSLIADSSKYTKSQVDSRIRSEISDNYTQYAFTGPIDIAYSSDVGSFPALAVIIYYPLTTLYDVHMMFSIKNFNKSYDSSSNDIFSFEPLYDVIRSKFDSKVVSLRFGDNSAYKNSFLIKCDSLQSSINTDRGLVLSCNGFIGYYSNNSLLYYSAGTNSGVYTPGSRYICHIYRAGSSYF